MNTDFDTLNLPAGAQPRFSPTPQQATMPRYQIVMHPNALPKYPFVILDHATGGYVPGGSPMFPRLFPTAAEAYAARPSDETVPADPGAQSLFSYGLGNGQPDDLLQSPLGFTPTPLPRYQTKPNPDAPARLRWGNWDNQEQDWTRDKHGFAHKFSTQAEAEANKPQEVIPGQAANSQPLPANTVQSQKPTVMLANAAGIQRQTLASGVPHITPLPNWPAGVRPQIGEGVYYNHSGAAGGPTDLQLAADKHTVQAAEAIKSKTGSNAMDQNGLGSSRNQSAKTGRDTRIYIDNPSHYTPPRTNSRGGHGPVTKSPGYDNRRYIINIPAGQDVDRNIAAALQYNQTVASQSGKNALKGFLMKYRYLQSNVANGTVGDYGKNFKQYPSNDPITIHQRRLGANFNLGAVGAALGFNLDTLLTAGNALSEVHTRGKTLHPQTEQDAIEDGYWYYYSNHPDAAKKDGVKVPSGYKFGR